MNLLLDYTDNTLIFTFNAAIGSRIICYLYTKMILILSLGNNNQMIQISDRRLSCDGKRRKKVLVKIIGE